MAYSTFFHLLTFCIIWTGFTCCNSIDSSIDWLGLSHQRQHETLSQVQNNALNILLHAQVDPSSGFIVGSVLTTSGMKEAFETMKGKENHVEIHYPFSYDHLTPIKHRYELLSAFTD